MIKTIVWMKKKANVVLPDKLIWREGPLHPSVPSSHMQIELAGLGLLDWKVVWARGQSNAYKKKDPKRHEELTQLYEGFHAVKHFKGNNLYNAASI